jgi:molybdopterin-binding protein
MSREAADELDLQVGSVAIAVIKSTTVVVEKPGGTAASRWRSGS